jgi:hypothetical protein
VELIETAIFTRQIDALLGDEEYGVFQSRIAANPGSALSLEVVGGFARCVSPLDREERAAAPVSSTIGRYEKT